MNLIDRDDFKHNFTQYAWDYFCKQQSYQFPLPSLIRQQFYQKGLHESQDTNLWDIYFVNPG